MVRSVSACLSWRDTFFGQRRTSCWRLRTKNGKPSDRLCRRTTHAVGLPSVGQPVQGLAFNGSSDKHHGTKVDHDSTVTLTESMDSNCTWTRESRNFRKSYQSWSFRTWFLLRCVQTNQKQSALKNWKEKEANLPPSISACSGRDRRSCIVKVCICKWTVVRVENLAACAVKPALFPWHTYPDSVRSKNKKIHQPEPTQNTPPDTYRLQKSHFSIGRGGKRTPIRQKRTKRPSATKNQTAGRRRLRKAKKKSSTDLNAELRRRLGAQQIERSPLVDWEGWQEHSNRRKEKGKTSSRASPTGQTKSTRKVNWRRWNRHERRRTSLARTCPHTG